MKKNFIAFLFLIIASISLVAQETLIKDKGSYKKNYTEGNLNIGDNEYQVALQYFLYAYKYDSSNANINFKVGFCYLNSANQKHLAEKYLEKAVQSVTKNYLDDDAGFKKAPIQAYFYLGQSYHLDGRLGDASKMYDTYESFVKPKDKEEHSLIQHFKKQVKNGEQLLGSPLNVSLYNLGDSVNSMYPDYSPVITADEQVLYYTTRRPNNAGGEKSEADGMYYEDIVVSYKDLKGNWSKPVSISPFINTGSNEATVSLAPDGQTLIIYKDVGNGDLFYSSFDGKDWTIPVKYGSNINTDYWETHACLSRDGNTLYFVSDRPGGLGGRDIYRCTKLPNGQWSLATNVGAPINTPYDEDGPFLGADGVTFYFASKGDQSMGGFDIMFSIIDENGKFSTPTNMGSPINTTDDDVFYVATPDNKRFYLSSAHEYVNKGDAHGKSFGDKDIYMGSVDIIKENPLALFRGRFVPGVCDSLPDDLSVVVTSVSNGEVIGTYRPQKRTGTFSVIIPPGSKYNFSYQQSGVELSSEEVFVPADISYEEIQKAINLKPLKICPGVIYKADTVVNKIALNVIVLNNKKEKKPVSKADIKLISKGTADYTAKTDDDGVVNGVALASGKSYELVASANGKTGKAVVFNTIGITGSKVYDKTIYAEKNPEDEINLPLAVTVLNNKTQRKPAVGAAVKVTGTDGSVFEGTTNDKGKITGINLNPETNYEIAVDKDGQTSKSLVSTHGIRKSKATEKTVYVQGASEIPDNSKISGDCFTFFFKYNMNEVDGSAPEYNQFIDKLLAFKTGGGKIVLQIKASASNVPTHKFKDNEDLAKMRANGTLDKIKASLKQRGVTDEDIIFSANQTSIGGPAYKGDYLTNAKEYEKYQFVKVCLTK